MISTNYNFIINISNHQQLVVPLASNQAVFVLGANGVGKSTLMHWLFQLNPNNTKRILAHRQTWFTSNSMSMTSTDKKNHEDNLKYADSNITSRWKDDYSQTRSTISIYNLINSQNIRARKIADALDANNIELAKSLSNLQSSLQAINELLTTANIPIKITLGENDQLLASKNDSAPYSIAELSDGERNAILICTDVLTAEPNHLIILDEPERHLHRSIISPLLSSLFQKRKDCAFVVSTHDVNLPIDHPESSILLVRSCKWSNKHVEYWEADLIPESNNIPNDIKREILGSKRNILFVEGESESLDRQIYQLIYPSVTVLPQGNCSQVEKAVDGITNTQSIHWINAVGLIDTDDRTDEQIQALLERKIAATKCYSVESLYYNLDVVQRVAKRFASIAGLDAKQLFKNATSDIIKNMQTHKERLCSRLCEKKIRNQIMSSLPKHKDILVQEVFKLTIDLKNILDIEKAAFDALVLQNDLNGLITRYPIRETPVLKGIVDGLGLDKHIYENMVRQLIIDDIDTQKFYRDLLSPLTNLIIGS